MVSATWNSALLPPPFKNKRPRNIVAAWHSSTVALTLVLFYHPGLNKIMFGRVSKTSRILTSILKNSETLFIQLWMRTSGKKLEGKNVFKRTYNLIFRKKTFFCRHHCRLSSDTLASPPSPTNAVSSRQRQSWSKNLSHFPWRVCIMSFPLLLPRCSTLNSVSIFWLAHIV